MSRLFARLLLCVAVLLGVVGAQVARADDTAGERTVSGTVIGLPDGDDPGTELDPIQDICVKVTPSGAAAPPEVATNAAGQFSIDNVPDGQTFNIVYRECRGGGGLPISPRLANQTAFATQAALGGAGATDPTIMNATLKRGAYIKGVITTTDGADEGTAPDPLGCTVTTLSEIGNTISSTVDGTYTLGPINSDLVAKISVLGSDCKRKVGDTDQNAPMVGEFFDDTVHLSQADEIPVEPAQIVEGRNFTLLPGGTISGTVSTVDGPDEGTEPDALGCVNVNTHLATDAGLDVTEIGIAGATVAANGTYTITGVPAVPLSVSFTDCGTDPAFKQEFWDNEKTAAASNVFLVDNGENRTGVNAQLTTLDPGGSNCTVQPFADVTNANNTFCEDIFWMHELGISTGTPNGQNKPLYKPVDAVSRQAMAAFLYRFVEGENPSPATCTTSPFPDVPASSQFCAAIDWLVDEGIAEGFQDGTFRPTTPVSRQAMAAFLFRAGGEPAVAECAAHFADVATASEFFEPIQWMFQSELSTGTPNGQNKPLYKPVDAVSRQAMAAFIHRFWSYVEDETPTCPT